MTETLAQSLEHILAGLMARTGALRCTVRIDHPSQGLSVNVPCAEVLAPGARSMIPNSAVDHRRARSIRSIEASRRPLVQGDVFADPVLAPPAALSEIFGTRAQIVAPLIGADDYMFGWVSAHFAEGPRTFTPSDIAAIEQARDAVLSLEGMPTDI